MLTVIFFAQSCHVLRFSYIFFSLIQIMYSRIRRLYIFAEKVELSKGSRDKNCLSRIPGYPAASLRVAIGGLLVLSRI